ncbi:SOS response-associated peptidase family protein [Aquabacterium soli]|nr:SOS response-associated peptidase family protein [Aquabacterium soli]
MCNLYQMEEALALRQSLGLLNRQLELPGFDARPVGPFQTGLFMVAHEGTLHGRLGQWGLIRPGQPERIDYIQPKPEPGKKPRAKRPRHTNNARIEAMDGTERPTNAAKVWKAGRRCLIPARWYQEPNWETKKNIWWHLKRADGQPWFLAGLWSDDWADPDTGEVIPSFTMITCNCDGHPLLSRLHRHDDKLPDNAQDKRSLVHVDPEDWEAWLKGPEPAARALIKPQPIEVFDVADAIATDAALAAQGTL